MFSHYDVPFVSQYTDLGDHQWRARGCGIAALKMVMDFYGSAPALDTLLQTGLQLGAYRDGIGWTHRGLVVLAEHFSYQGYAVDVALQSPTPKTPEEAWGLLLEDLKKGPLLVSIWRYLDPQPSGGHLVVVTGWDGTLVALNDPIELAEREGKKLLAQATFERLFKQRWMVVQPAALASAERG